MRVLLVMARTCLSREMEYRGHFLLLALSNIGWTLLTLSMVPFLFSNIRTVEGWDLDRMILLTGTYQLVLGILYLLFETNMGRLSEYVNKGELDYVLLKPIDSQFLVSTRYLTFNQAPAVVVALATVVVGWTRLGLQPEPLQLVGYVAMVLSAIVSFYSLWFGSVTFVLWTGRIENIQFLMMPVMEMARVPADIFRGLARPLFTFVVPVALIGTLPTKALLGLLDPALALYAVAFAAMVLYGSHRFWAYSLHRYSSASS
jgi:ABC-2 type transport system permease protein